MGIYLNPTNQNFYEAVNKEIYVDKSLLIQHIEYLRNKVNKYICVSRPRRFGKSTDADMLVAYYSYEALQVYIDMNYDGLKDNIVQLLSGESVDVNTSKFQNDMTTFKSKDDVLTLLIHLGYLEYNSSNYTCFIPNKEVSTSFINSIEDSNWQETTRALLNSRELLEATWRKDEKAVAIYIEEAHLDTSILTYNNENALSYTLALAYIYARNHYTMIREMPTGEGFADIVLIPYRNKPAMIIELKWNQEAKTAINQIKEKNYPKELEKYKDNLLLVAISYDKKTKKHTCHIEEIGKEH